jgi:hypothetical protein
VLKQLIVLSSRLSTTNMVVKVKALQMLRFALQLLTYSLQVGINGFGRIGRIVFRNA